MNTRISLALVALALFSGEVRADPPHEGWRTHADPAMLMYPMRLPSGWKLEARSQTGISLVRVTAPDGLAAIELYTGFHHGTVDARGLARIAIANLLGASEPEGSEVFRDEQRTLTGVFEEIAIRGVSLGSRAAVVIAMTGHSGPARLLHYRTLIAPKEDPTGLFDRLVAEHFADLTGPITSK